MPHTDLRLLHLTDTHLFQAADARLRGVDTCRSLAAVLEDAAGHPQRPDAVLATGDLSQDETPGAYDRFREMLARSGAPVWCLPGNHDAPAHMARTLSRPPFHFGGVLTSACWSVILVDSHLPGDHGGRLGPDRLAQLETMLAENRGQHVLLAVHHHVLKLGSRWLDDLGLYDADDLLAVIDRSPQVRAVLAGHVHQASDRSRNGVRYLTSPSTCFQFLPGIDDFAVDTRPPGYRWLDLLRDGTLRTEVVWVEPPQ